MKSIHIYGGQFEPQNRNNPRTIIANWVASHSYVLEVGPGDGVISLWLKQMEHCRTVGVEFVPEAAEVARPAFDDLIIGNIEDKQIQAEVQVLAPFDVIIFADVLEHLVDPWTVLRRVQPMLKPQGRVLLSVPNIAHWSARINLLFGHFDYTDKYLMDRTHLRWFTHKSAREMARTTGYKIVDEGTVHRPRFMRFVPELSGFQIVLNLAPIE